MRLKSREIFFAAPQPGVLMYGNSFYTRREGVEKVRVRTTETKSDLLDTVEFGYSGDNGRTWSNFTSVPCVHQTPKGTVRRFFFPGFIDPESGWLLQIGLEGLLPNDDPEEGMKHFFLRYQVSTDGGRTHVVDEVIVQKGPYTADHPCEGVRVGKNAIMLGDLGCRPIRTKGGEILVPVQICPVGPDGEYYNPGGGYTYHEAAVLIGRWRDDMKMEWDLSPRIANDPTRSTRGCIEPTLAELPDGRIIMVLRGSNGGTKDPECKIPGYRWYSVSNDSGHTWSPVRPWTYSNGKSFFSPSSCSQLLRHSNGQYYWLGNISPQNPKANGPRYPFIIGRVDPDTGLLIEDSVFKIDDRQPGEHEELMLSCFMAHEDRETGEIILHMSRGFPQGVQNWGGDAYIYRIEP